jgi:hypothetical protein
MWWGTPSPIFWPTPRRCPVDDAPHTTCTSADYDGTPNATNKRIVINQLPMRDEQLAASRPAVSPPPPDRVVTLQPGEVTTATYKRRRRA